MTGVRVEGPQAIEVEVEYLPQIRLHVTGTGDILAEAIEGIVWGHTSDQS
ncbi:MAG TPA: hypothetical protein VHB98_20490 [Chloroflexota bacterium]|nr:hypothetical protein [Chloroflexota bacterium]